MNSRADALLTFLSPCQMFGLEIGPLDKPMVPKSHGKVLYADHLSQQALQAYYRDDPNVSIEDIRVDVVLDGRPLAALMGTDMKFDYVVASHVVEHVPDLVGWLKQVREVLKPTGELRLAVPDRRFTFDFLRQTSTLPDVLAAYVASAQVPQPRAVLDHYLHVASLDLTRAWQGTIDRQALKRGHAADALALARRVVERGDYLEIHVWVFTPVSFAQIMIELAEQGICVFRCTFFVDTMVGALEFMVGLAPSDCPTTIIHSWQQLIASAHNHDPEFNSDAAGSARRLVQGMRQRCSAKKNIGSIAEDASF